MASNSKVEAINSHTNLEYLEESAGKSYGKYLRFKLKPSLFGIRQAKEFKVVEAHPLFLKGEIVNADYREKQDFLSDLRKFKPKTSIFDLHEVEGKQELLKRYHDRAEVNRKRRIREKEIDNEIQKNKNDQSDEEKKEIEEEKEEENKEEQSDELLKNKRKRSKMRNFKENGQYVSEKADPSKNLWGAEKPLDLEELTVNILADDNEGMKKQKFVWDNKKRNFTYAKLDEGGKIIRKNESGKVVKKSDKFQTYKKWQQKTKLKVQRVGEKENSNVVNGALENFKERKFQKRTKHKKAGNGAKSEIKNYDQLVKGKKKEFIKKNKKPSFRKDAKTKFIKKAIHGNSKSFRIKKMGK